VGVEFVGGTRGKFDVVASDVSSVLYGLVLGGGSITVIIEGSANLVLFCVPVNSTVYAVVVKGYFEPLK